MKNISCRYGLVGDDLELKENVNIDVDDEGIISNISFKDPKKEIDLSQNKNNFIAIPGFINSHTHIGDNFAKEMGYNKELKQIVSAPIGLKHRLLERASKDIKVLGIQNAVEEMLSNGITFFIDYRERSIEGITLLKEALIESPINFQILGRFESNEELREVFQLADGIGIPNYNRIDSNNLDMLKKLKEKSEKLVSTHCAEKVREEELVQKLFSDQLVDVIIHGTQFIEEDLQKIKSNNISLVLCPINNSYFGLGFPPILEIIRLNIPISLGTDNFMTNSPDLFEEMRYFFNIFKVLNKENTELSLSAIDLLKMVTINAARNFKLDKKIGSIKKGKSADLFMINLNDINFYSADIDSSLLYPLIVQRTKVENIKKVYIKGNQVFKR
ncbi:MAG: amidohydrolase family protein [Candidatus Lokiarchaeota archaeon]|nr:amidohydrolase family protein [Candidatus Lokiarchaeota archaeon]